MMMQDEDDDSISVQTMKYAEEQSQVLVPKGVDLWDDMYHSKSPRWRLNKKKKVPLEEEN